MTVDTLYGECWPLPFSTLYSPCPFIFPMLHWTTGLYYVQHNSPNQLSLALARLIRPFWPWLHSFSCYWQLYKLNLIEYNWIYLAQLQTREVDAILLLTQTQILQSAVKHNSSEICTLFNGLFNLKNYKCLLKINVYLLSNGSLNPQLLHAPWTVIPGILSVPVPKMYVEVQLSFWWCDSYFQIQIEHEHK